jgi:hypothetical protein
MDYIPVSSTTVSAVGYDRETNTLGVRFQNGTEYHYFGVPEEIFVGLQSAGSVGSYFDQCVKKPGYAYTRVG